MRRLVIVFLLLLLLPFASAHSGHAGAEDTPTQLFEKCPPDLSWQQWHMIQEHNIQDFDPESFFHLHVSSDKSHLLEKDILNMYGLLRDKVVGKGDGMGKHDDSEGISEDEKHLILTKVLNLIDLNNDRKISFNEWLNFINNNGNLPDFGVGPGHHSDDFEYEYEVHHWNKYHQDDDPDVKILHKEDIEHELLHHEHDIDHAYTEQDTQNLNIDSKDPPDNDINNNTPKHKVIKINDSYLNTLINLYNIPTKYLF
ncbi:nucleobindin SSP120 ASCRUDRAFT_75684 [Ascoidea rubescens DSM 1968]|uniref:EF-hand domain-containing protein n=1 Tax=Ascoidea rubescens DSM 1968 TaxID=1344418 RepID=A0A1D2VJC0_9ASCO|nr:hypothetical protein ASCRUDRAFT_75684 [Ascoidea rubescens DSM 1968]ODV61711.1 hypothetical protein ASCRUDRAFT_75684 [Ascoidea rubescens DSM 1968]